MHRAREAGWKNLLQSDEDKNVSFHQTVNVLSLRQCECFTRYEVDRSFHAEQFA